ncbi:MAG TPA: hypothetical protein VGF45_12300 [Polyangia bacterium]
MSFPRQVLAGTTYLVTRRCTQRQFLLRPDRDTNNAFVYCLAYAALKAQVDVIAFVANANHYHAVVVDKHGTIPKFLEIFHKLLAKHQNALRGRWENLWSTEQTSLVELVGPEDIFAKVIYTLTNPVKDHLVERAHHWPGASSLDATTHGKTFTARRPLKFFRNNGEMPEQLELRCVRPPGFESLSPVNYHERIQHAVSEVEGSAAAERRISGRRILGRRAVLDQNPTDRPQSKEPRRQLDPRVGARERWPRIEALQRLKIFRAAYAAARDAWLGDPKTIFPPGTWWLRRFAAVACAAVPTPA